MESGNGYCRINSPQPKMLAGHNGIGTWSWKERYGFRWLDQSAPSDRTGRLGYLTSVKVHESII
jgi:hypothetical protein